jgi:DNA replication protein DnaC
MSDADSVGQANRHWPIIGRQAELDQLLTFCRGGGSAMIVGQAGVGKTRLAQAAMDEAASDGWRTEFAVASRVPCPVKYSGGLA